MGIAVLLLILAGTLFVIAFLMKRRFGVLGLALAAGAMLSSLWAETLTPVIEEAGVAVNQPPLATIVAMTLVVLPSVVLLFNGPSYSGLLPRLVGAASYAILALALLIEPLSSSLYLDGLNEMVFSVVEQNRVFIVTAGLSIALFDILFTRTPKHHKQAKH